MAIEWFYESALHALVAQVIIWDLGLIDAWQATFSISRAHGFGASNARPILCSRSSGVRGDGEGGSSYSKVI